MALKDKLKKFAAPIIGGVVLAAGISGLGFTQVSAAAKADTTAVSQAATDDITVTSDDPADCAETKTKTRTGSDTDTDKATERATDSESDSDTESDLDTRLSKGNRGGMSAEEEATLAAKATVTQEAAAKTATDANSGYTVDINHLEDEDGTILYEIKMSDTSGNRLEVKIDANSGAILSSEPFTGEAGRNLTGTGKDGSGERDGTKPTRTETSTKENDADSSPDTTSETTADTTTDQS